MNYSNKTYGCYFYLAVFLLLVTMIKLRQALCKNVREMLQFATMTTIQEIKTAIGTLPHPDYMRLLGWIHDMDWGEWDAELEADVESGQLDFLANEALEAKKMNKLRDI